MQKLFLLIIFSSTLSSLAAQNSVQLSIPKLYQPTVSSRFFKLGERTVEVKTFQYGNSRDKVYINLHDDEITAINGAKKLLEKKGGYLIKIENYRTRNIRFKLEGKYYTIDPNRMFSRIGIERSLIISGNTSPKAIDEIEKFANHILQLIPGNASWIIALHNNTNGKYSINSYLPGGEKETDAKGLNVNDELDADDFFLTTDSILFYRLAGEKYNAILQDNVNVKKDGSLSVYCGEQKIHYVNCETEHGRQPEYDAMIVSAVKQIEEKTSDIVVEKRTGTIVYGYRIPFTGQQFLLTANTEIFFGEKKVGMLQSVMTDAAGTVTGQFEINREFPVYSNMDFFLFISSAIDPRLEIRIDPTRRKEPINTRTAVIPIILKFVN